MTHVLAEADGTHMPPNLPSVIVVMGVSGAGKSTIGALLAQRLARPYHDGDDFHPAGNVAKMRAGKPLDDGDRRPWLAAINRFARDATAGNQPVVIGCSALKSTYRAWLADGVTSMRFVHLAGSRELIAARLAARSGHFMPATLLDSQFATLEAPADALTIPIEASPEEIVEDIVRALLARA